MMTSHILKRVDFTKTQISRYLKKETLFFLQTKKLINYTSKATLWQKIVINFSSPEITSKAKFPNDFRQSRNSLIRLNLLNIKSKTWRESFIIC